jgi:hypothetical protein
MNNLIPVQSLVSRRLVTFASLQRMVREGILKFERVGGNIFVRRSDWDGILQHSETCFSMMYCECAGPCFCNTAP